VLYSLQTKANIETSNALAIGRIKARVDVDKERERKVRETELIEGKTT
jgi:hypothetical protein